jgi:tRNA nucleotidyltransferase (CCA-adding enzyme)
MLPLNQVPVKLPPLDHVGASALLGRLTPALAGLLWRAAALAAGRAARLWLVGGAVRDLLRGEALGYDLDLAVEGEVAELAPALAAVLGGRVLASHAAFGTASVAVPDGYGGELRLDLARTRAEEYPQPAALPLVRPAGIDDDLGRRDYSANAIALELLSAESGLRPGALLDPFGGRDDLAAGRLRLLHPASLRDDPTRLLRGLRLAARLGLQPDQATAAQIAEALQRGYLALLTPERLLGEICLALVEPQPAAVLALADAWRATPQIAPGLAWSAALAERCARFAADRATKRAPDGALVMAGLLCYDLDAGQIAGLLARLPLPAAFAGLIGELAPLRAAAAALATPMRPSEIDRLLRPFSADAIAVLHYGEMPPVGALAARYLHELRPARPPLDGRGLQRLGVPPGPQIGRLLAELRAAYLDGQATTTAAAENWVRAQLHNDQPGSM